MRDQKLTPRSRTQHPTCSQNRHWAAEGAKVRGGAAKATTGDHCRDGILYRLRYREPMEYITHVDSDGRKLGQPPQQDEQPNAELGPAEPRYQEEAQPAENSSSQYGWLQMRGQGGVWIGA